MIDRKPLRGQESYKRITENGATCDNEGCITTLFYPSRHYCNCIGEGCNERQGYGYCMPVKSVSLCLQL